MLEDLSKGDEEPKTVQPTYGIAGLTVLLAWLLVAVWINLEIVMGWYYATISTTCAGVVLVTLVVSLIVFDYRRHRR